MINRILKALKAFLDRFKSKKKELTTRAKAKRHEKKLKKKGFKILEHRTEWNEYKLVARFVKYCIANDKDAQNLNNFKKYLKAFAIKNGYHAYEHIKNGYKGRSYIVFIKRYKINENHPAYAKI